MIKKNKILICSLSMILLLTTQFYGCKKVNEISLPVIDTTVISKITQSSATLTATISNDGGAAISERGFCRSLSQNPTVTDNKSLVAGDSTRYDYNITGLSNNITYYVRSYAINSTGVSYGNEVSFTLWLNIPGPIVMDIDGNTYKTVKIGTQVWMSENLRTTKYRNGEPIGTTTPDTLDIRSESTPKYQWTYRGYDSQIATYGKLYTWYAVNDSRNIAPAGWHVATDEEWGNLVNYLGGQMQAGARLKETGTRHWNSPNTSATNESGFTALPSGYRAENGFFYNYFGVRGYWWSSTMGHKNTVGIDWMIDNSSQTGDSGDIGSLGLSVRCVKD